MNLFKLVIGGLLTVFSFAAVAGSTEFYLENTKKRVTSSKQDEDKPSIQTDNFKRKGKIGYESVIQETDTENVIGDKGTISKKRSDRKGKIGYNAIIKPDDTVSPEREISDKKGIENNWRDRKGKIGYDAVIE